MKRLSLAVCLLTTLGATAPAFADCAGHAAAKPTGSTASVEPASPSKGG